MNAGNLYQRNCIVKRSCDTNPGAFGSLRRLRETDRPWDGHSAPSTDQFHAKPQTRKRRLTVSMTPHQCYVKIQLCSSPESKPQVFATSKASRNSGRVSTSSTVITLRERPTGWKRSTSSATPNPFEQASFASALHSTTRTHFCVEKRYGALSPNRSNF